MVRWLTAAAIVAATGASAQTVIDGSGETIPKKRLQEVLRLTADEFPEPETTRFRKLTSAGGHAIVCGEVNAKNRFGAYDGYRLFYLVEDTKPLLSPIEDGPSKDSMIRLVSKCNDNLSDSPRR